MNNDNGQKVLYFYDTADEFVRAEDIYLNNFEVTPFKALEDGFVYQTAEHYYQCHKFDNFDVNPNFKAAYEEIRNATDPLACKKLARKYEKEFEGIWRKDEWEKGYKETIMKRALTLKFSQHRDLLERLVQTGDAKLVEYSKKDPYWGGLLPDSKNRLGAQLMELRDNFVHTKQVWLEGSGYEPL